jgi:hypothetical protein
MPQFNDLKTAFAWWLENEYPNLPSEDKNTLKIVKHDFLKRNRVSSDKIQAIMAQYGDFKITVEYEKKVINK